MLINDHNLDMLNAREDWTNWINSIEDLVVRNDVSNSKRYKIENLSESQICDAFIEASREVNPPFYNYMKSKEAQVENEKNLIKEAAKIMKQISNAFLTALNEINPDHASNGSITKAQNTTNRALRTFRKLNPTLSERKITIGFCIRQFRTMAPPKLLGDEQPMPHSKRGSVTMAGTRKTRRASPSRKDSEHNLHLRAQTLLY
ncbi:hypothetical protein QWA68_015667 [Fusarium oxysporum]|nr:hypothetical protein QWA68_015667 [Fusarium oxysporum]